MKHAVCFVVTKYKHAEAVCPHAAAEEGVRAVVSLQQECDLATWGVNYADLQWRAGELGVRLQRCPVRPKIPIPDRPEILSQA